tara:strand:- start:757 stop:1206 length:450 start_codon:yes stop_codon:yes gene_type:complete
MKEFLTESIFNSPPLESEIKPVDYYKPNLPNGINEFHLRFFARRAINKGADLSQSSVRGLPVRMMAEKIKENISNQDAIKNGFKSRRELIQKFTKSLILKERFLTHAITLQKKILEKEFEGVFPIEPKRYLYDLKIYEILKSLAPKLEV